MKEKRENMLKKFEVIKKNKTLTKILASALIVGLVVTNNYTKSINPLLSVNASEEVKQEVKATMDKDKDTITVSNIGLIDELNLKFYINTNDSKNYKDRTITIYKSQTMGKYLPSDYGDNLSKGISYTAEGENLIIKNFKNNKEIKNVKVSYLGLDKKTYELGNFEIEHLPDQINDNGNDIIIAKFVDGASFDLVYKYRDTTGLSTNEIISRGEKLYNTNQ